MSTLELIMRPAGGGIHLVSTGLEAQRALQRALYDVADAESVARAWRADLERLSAARVAIIGAPSDAGAGFTRGSNRAPEALRRRLIARRDHPYHDPRVVDVGDLRVIPHLLSDAMLQPAQIEACRRALYGADAPQAAHLPVSPLDLLAAVLDHLYGLNEAIVPIVLGGDHSLGWPSFQASHAHSEGKLGARLGVVHIDAHTDLMPHRLGVRHCFATWAYHANEALGRDGRLVQVGIRASGKPREHWESTLGVRQLWASACTDALACADLISAHFDALGVQRLHISHDIDGTDASIAAATGTPEPDGLEPAFVRRLVCALGERWPLVSADLVEVAPPLAGQDPDEPLRTIDCALDYLADLLDSALQGPPS